MSLIQTTAARARDPRHRTPRQSTLLAHACPGGADQVAATGTATTPRRGSSTPSTWTSTLTPSLTSTATGTSDPALDLLDLDVRRYREYESDVRSCRVSWDSRTSVIRILDGRSSPRPDLGRADRATGRSQIAGLLGCFRPGGVRRA